MEDTLKYAEEKQRYVFLKTVKKDDEVIALMADAQVLGEGGVRSLQLAFNAHAAPVSRVGVLPMTQQQLEERLPELRDQRLDASEAAFRRAIACIKMKTAPDSSVQKKVAQPTA